MLFDPLDGSSNIDVNVSVGTIFSIFALPEETGTPTPTARSCSPAPSSSRPATSSTARRTIMVYTTGHGVHGFTLDPPSANSCSATKTSACRTEGSIYSSNDAYWDTFPNGYQDYIMHLRSGETGRKYSLRYIGSLVADFHRTLLHGGVFLYPPTKSHPNGKLRLLYEANPVAFIAEQAGGIALDGQQRILDIAPTTIHQRTPLMVGSQAELELFQRFVKFGR